MRFRSAETKFIFISFVVVFLLGIKTVASLIDQPLADSGVSFRRQPASVVKSNQPTELEKHLPRSPAAANLDFNCLKDSPKELIVKAAYLQIRGKGCAKAVQGDQVSIVNKSNGYTAAVFPMGQEGFQTDLIQLIEGQNQILIQYQNSNGKKFQREVVVKSSHI